MLQYLIFPEAIRTRNWPTFDPEADRYFDSVQWEEHISNGVHRYTLLTVVEWDLKHVYQ